MKGCKCRNCKAGEMIKGFDIIKSEGKKYELYVCTNCDVEEYAEVKRR